MLGTQRKNLVLTCVVVLLVLGVGCQSNQTAGPGEDDPTDSGNPSVEAPPEVGLDGIVELSWGADTTVARKQLGEPDKIGQRRGKRPVISYVYTDRSFQGYPTRTILYFGREDGLILVALKVPLDSGEDCEQMFRTFESVIRKANPSLEPTVYRDNPTDDPFCQAVRNGEARWEKGWIYENSPSVGALTLNPGDTQVEMAFTSSGFGKYIQRRTH